MKWQFIFLLVVLPSPLHSQSADLEKWNTVGRTCGQLARVDEVPVKGHASEFTEKSHTVKRADIRLYRRDGDAVCCKAEMMVAQTSVKHSGAFEFQNVLPGKYWVVVIVDRDEYKLAVSYAPDNKKAEAACADLLYELRKSGLELKRVIQVD